MVSVSASVNLPLHHKVQKFSSGTGSPCGPRKRAIKQLWWLVQNLGTVCHIFSAQAQKWLRLNFWWKFGHQHLIPRTRFPYTQWYFGNLWRFSVDDPNFHRASCHHQYQLNLPLQNSNRFNSYPYRVLPIRNQLLPNNIDFSSLPSVLWRCWLDGRKGIRPVKTEWWGTGMVICLQQGANYLHMVQLMPPPPPSPRAPVKSRMFYLSGAGLRS